MAKRLEIYRKMREEGMTYEQIGRIYGVSRQAVYDTLHYQRGDGFHWSAIKKIRWVGLRDWMLSNRVTFTKLGELTGVKNFRATIHSDCEPRKSTIDAILKVTGLTYEECFREEILDEE